MALITREKFSTLESLDVSSTWSYLKMTLNTDHKKKVSHQLSPFISIHIDPIQKFFLSLTTRKKSSTWFYLKMSLDSQEKVLTSWVPLSTFEYCSCSKMIFDNDHKKKVSLQLSPFMNLQLDLDSKMTLDTDNKKKESLYESSTR